MGRVKIRFAPKNPFGVLDHEVTLPDGTVVQNPLRVQPNGDGSEVLFTLYRQPEASDAAFAEDAAKVRKDLETLKGILEGKQERVPDKSPTSSS